MKRICLILILFFFVSSIHASSEMHSFSSNEKVFVTKTLNQNKVFSYLSNNIDKKISLSTNLSSKIIKDSDEFSCSITIIVTWSNGEEVTANFSGSDCDAVKASAQRWLCGLQH